MNINAESVDWSKVSKVFSKFKVKKEGGCCIWIVQVIDGIEAAIDCSNYELSVQDKGCGGVVVEGEEGVG